MAEEINISAPTGNGPERMEVRLGPGTLGFSTKNILPIFAVLGAFALIFAAGYFIAMNLTSGQERGHGDHALMTQLINTVSQANIDILTRFHEAELDLLTRNHQAEMDLLIRNHQASIEDRNTQNALLTAQTRELQQAVLDNTRVISGRLSVHDYNTGRALENRLPLDVDPSQLPLRQEGPR
jgi:hypothetical protein